MSLRLRWRALRRGADERGAVLIIVAGCLVLFLGLLAYTLDLGAGRQGQQKAQEVADASAEAGANAIPYPACTSTDTTCISNVKTQASTIASDNGACAACVTINYPYGDSYSEVQVLVSATSAGTVGGAFGRASIPVSAKAIASAQSSTSTSISLSSSVSSTVTASKTTVVTPGTNVAPTAVFAADSKCSDDGLTIGENLTGTDAANNISLSGSVFSNGSLLMYYTGSNGNFRSTVTYGSGCSFNRGSGNYSVAPSTVSTPYSYPIDFSTLNIPCDHDAATFSWTGTNPSIPAGIYCATSSITVNLSSGGNLNAIGVTFVAPTVSISAPNCVMTPASDAPDYLLIYNEGSSPLDIDCPSNLSLTSNNLPGGAIFSPDSAINITSQNFDTNGFIEGEQVHIALGSGGTMNLTGDGAASGPGSTATTSTQTTNITNSSTITSTVTSTSTLPNGSALSG